MKKQKKDKVFHGIFLLYMLICVVIAMFSFQYYASLHKTIRLESQGYLKEVAQRIGTNIDRIIEDNYSVLYTMAASLEATGTDTMADARSLLKKQQAFWDYQTVLIVDNTGKTYDLDGREVFAIIDDSIRQSVLNKEETMSTTQVVNNKECIIFSVPLNDLILDGKTMVAMGLSYSPDTFDQVLSMNSFDEKAYSQIITKSGTIVTRTTSPYAIKSGYNIFTTIEKAKLDEGEKLDEVKKEILSDKGGQIGFELEGVRRYMVYTPIQPDEWYLLTFVPVEVVNEKSDMMLKVTLVLCGVVTLAFIGLMTTLAYSFNNNRKKLEKMAYVDEVTGGNTAQRFYELARAALDAQPQNQYALLYTNMCKFKVLNEQLGRQNCDKILWYFHDYMKTNLINEECMGRISADNFCILMRYEDEMSILKRLDSWYQGAAEYAVKVQMPWALPTTEFGIYVMENRTVPFPLMIDRAKLALRESSGTVDGKHSYAFYDDNIRRQLLREKQLEDMMSQALENREYRVFLQPKYLVQEEVIGGAEALVRWQSADEGMIYPDEFIPLFEKNGFIIQLDLWVYEEVCRTIRKWMDSGLEVIKVSVNCSRIHFKDANFLAPYIRIADKYQIPRDKLEIELTESVVFENVERLTKIIENIRAEGFGCSMDDFGSGYSSLNLIQSIPVDTLKMDKIFFKEGTSNIERTEAIVGSIVRMAQQLHMKTVAEGVEHREQVEMLRRVECDFIQGYVFARPMSIDKFEELAFGESIE